jgi:LysM repeat protein
MKEDPELQLNDNWSEENARPARRRRGESDDNKRLPVLLGVILVLILLGGIVYFLGKGTSGNEPNPMESRVTALEQKIAVLEKQIAELQEKSTASRPAPVAVQKPAPAAAPPAPLASKASASPEKRYHTVQKGETLSGIGAKYGTPVEELRKLNNLPANKSIRVGQKLLVSNGR